MSLIFFDLETTHLDTAIAAAHQLGAIKIVREGNRFVEKDSFFGTMKPWQGAAIEKEALDVTETSREKLFAYPAQFKTLSEFKTWAGPGHHTLGGWGTESYDMPILKRGMERQGLAYNGHFHRTTMDLKPITLFTALYFTEQWRHPLENFSLKYVAPLLGLGEQPKPHNALSDARLALDLLNYLLERIEVDNGQLLSMPWFKDTAPQSLHLGD